MAQGVTRAVHAGSGGYSGSTFGCRQYDRLCVAHQRTAHVVLAHACGARAYVRCARPVAADAVSSSEHGQLRVTTAEHVWCQPACHGTPRAHRACWSAHHFRCTLSYAPGRRTSGHPHLHTPQQTMSSPPNTSEAQHMLNTDVSCLQTACWVWPRPANSFKFSCSRRADRPDAAARRVHGQGGAG